MSKYTNKEETERIKMTILRHIKDKYYPNSEIYFDKELQELEERYKNG